MLYLAVSCVLTFNRRGSDIFSCLFSDVCYISLSTAMRVNRSLSSRL